MNENDYKELGYEDAEDWALAEEWVEDDEWEEDDDCCESESQDTSDEVKDPNGLLPCPFCGGPAEYFTREGDTGYYLMAPYTEHVVKCRNDSCCINPESYSRDKDQAINDWNKRPEDYKKENA